MPLLQVKADMALSDVLGGLTPDAEENDYIKSQVKFAQHYGQYGWHGQLQTLPTDAMYKASPTFRDAPPPDRVRDRQRRRLQSRRGIFMRRLACA